jgi:hypothetical protein
MPANQASNRPAVYAGRAIDRRKLMVAVRSMAATLRPANPRDQISSGNRFADTVQTRRFLSFANKSSKYLNLLVSAEGLEPSTP